MLRTTRVRVALAAAGTAIMLAGATPASAETVTVADPADTRPSPTDIRRVTVDHDLTRLVVLVDFTNLRRNTPGGGTGLTIRLDTRADRPGSEFVLTTGLQEGTDYQLMRVRKGKVVGEPLTCSHRVRLGYAADRLRFRVGRDCIGMPAQVRVAPRMQDRIDPSHPLSDVLSPRWTRWVASS
jgi:hypothetical protein